MSRRSMRLRRSNARRGRPREVGVPRTASGRKSRGAATAGRSALRRPGSAAPQSSAWRRNSPGTKKAATVLGRLWLAGDISEPLCDAGERYLEIHNEAMRALKAPMGLAVSGVVGSAGDQVSEDYAAWAQHAVARYETLKDVLRTVGAFSARHKRSWSRINRRRMEG